MLNKPKKKKNNNNSNNNNNNNNMSMNYIVSDDEESRSETWDFPTNEDMTTNSMLMMMMDSNHLSHNSNHNDDDILATNNGTTDTGILIVDGKEEDENDDTIATNEEGAEGTVDDVLSYPESIPTYIGSLMEDDHHGSDASGSGDMRRRRRRHAIILLVAGTSLLLLFMILASILVWDRHGLLQRNQALEEQIVELQTLVKKQKQQQQQQQQQTDSLIAKAELDWENEDFFTNTKILLADNCWIKAEVELRECVDHAKESLEEFSSGAYKVFKDLFYPPTTDNDTHDPKTDPEDSTDNALQLAGLSWTSLSKAADVVSSAAIHAVDSMTTMSKAMDESVMYALQQTRNVVQDATQYTREL